MARLILILSILFAASSLAMAQNLDANRTTDWSKAGCKTQPVNPSVELNILDFGADPTGLNSSIDAYSQALQELNDQSGTIFFPAGEYFFDSGISIPDSVKLVGESTQTVLRFDLGGQGNLIYMNGSMSSDEVMVDQPIQKGDVEISLTNSESINTGDIIRLGCNDEQLMYSSWAYGTLGQVVEVIGKSGNTLVLADPLTRNYSVEEEPYIRKVNPVRNAGLSCLKMERVDATSSQTSNIYIRNAVDCTIENVESINCNFAHVSVNSSAHISITGGYFHHAHAYGGGGQGYGVVFQETSSFNLAENNVFEHLRHSMLLQSGATGNVCGFNYSIDPYWVSGMLPSNSAGDAVLHGNYPHHNLFEGNVVQNMVVDASHGNNGPFNTFFRNRGELYGFYSDANTPTDSMNIIGNEITNSGFPLGLFMVNGNGHYQYGNNVYGTLTPSGTQNIELETLYKTNDASTGTIDIDVPTIGFPNSLGGSFISAQTRFLEGSPVSCGASVVTQIENEETHNVSVPFVYNETLNLPSHLLPAQVEYYSSSGSLVTVENVYSNQSELPTSIADGIYVLRCIGENQQANIKVLISR